MAYPMFSPQEQAQIVNRYLCGESGIAICRDVGCSDGTCYNILSKHGVKRRSATDVSYRTHQVDASFFHEIDTEQNAYWLGFIAADGCINVGPKGHSIIVGLALSDSLHLHKLRNAIGFTGEVQTLQSTKKKKDSEEYLWNSVLRVNCKEMVGDLLALGVTPRKSLTLTPPLIRHDLERHFWRGMVDGDGCIYPKGNSLSLCGTKAVCDAFETFCNTIVPINNTTRPTSTIYSITITGVERIQCILSVLYGDCSVALDRKVVSYHEFMESDVKPPEYNQSTKEELLSLYDTLGTWRSVASHIGMKYGSLIMALKRKGIVTHCRELMQMSMETVLDSYSKCGTWTAVEKDLGVSESWLWRKKHEWGLL